MGTYYSSWSSKAGIKVRLKVVTSYTQNIANNTSTVTVKLYGESKKNSSYPSYDAINLNYYDATKLVHTGSTYRPTGYFMFENDASRTMLLKSATKTITHNSSGNASFSFSATADWTYSDYEYGTISIGTKTISLPTITRTSSISSNATSSTEFGDTINLTITRHDSSFTHDINYKMGNQSGSIASDVSTSSSWEIPTSLIQYVTDSDKSNISITCVTKKGTTTIGSNTITITAKVPDSYVPTCSLALSVLNDVNWNIYLKGFSKVVGTITASGNTGSTIKSYQTSGNGEILTTNPFTSGLLKNNDSETFVTTVTDSRGRTATDSKKISIVNYYLPTINKLKIQRCLQDGTLDEDGTYGKVTIDYAINPVEYYAIDANGLLVVESGAESGEINLEDVTPTMADYQPAVNDRVSLQQLNTKQVSVSSSGTSFSETLTNFEGEQVLSTLIPNLSTKYSYEIEVAIVDSITSYSQPYTVSPSFVLESDRAGGKGKTLGRRAIRDGFDVYMDSYFNNKNNYFKRQNIDGTITEKSGNIYIRYIE